MADQDMKRVVYFFKSRSKYGNYDKNSLVYSKVSAGGRDLFAPKRTKIPGQTVKVGNFALLLTRDFGG